MSRMQSGTRFEFGDVVLAQIPFIEKLDWKSRPAVVLFEEQGTVVVLGVTSNLQRPGVPVSREDGFVKNSIIRLNYVFTLNERMIYSIKFVLDKEKRQEVRNRFDMLLRRGKL